METTGYYQSIESFGLVDGPGVRSILFLQGCRMRCLFCHNPDTWEIAKGEAITPEDAYEKLSHYAPYWGKDGGVTVSGGEPLLQIDFLVAFAKICHSHGVRLAIDTAGEPFTRLEPYFSKFDELLSYADLLILDIKSLDAKKHLLLTTKSNENILDLFRYLDERKFPIWVRQVLVPGYTDEEKELKATGDFIASLHNVLRVEVLPYHTLGVYKYEKLGLPYRLQGVKPPSDEAVKKAETLLRIEQYQGYLPNGAKN